MQMISFAHLHISTSAHPGTGTFSNHQISTLKILMVCLGNICRSPLAQGIMQHLVDEQGLGWEIDSAGTGNWHVGGPPDVRSVNVAYQHGIDISKQVCRILTKEDFDTFDHILVMDRSNLSNVLRMAPNDTAAKKVKLLLIDKEVPDPYYDDAQFALVFELIQQGCTKMIKTILKSAGH